MTTCQKAMRKARDMLKNEFEHRQLWRFQLMPCGSYVVTCDKCGRNAFLRTPDRAENLNDGPNITVQRTDGKKTLFIVRGSAVAGV